MGLVSVNKTNNWGELQKEDYAILVVVAKLLRVTSSRSGVLLSDLPVVTNILKDKIKGYKGSIYEVVNGVKVRRGVINYTNEQQSEYAALVRRIVFWQYMERNIHFFTPSGVISVQRPIAVVNSNKKITFSELVKFYVISCNKFKTEKSMRDTYTTVINYALAGVI